MLAARHDVFGRDSELDVAMTFLSDEAFGGLVLAGAAGIGKTTLWNATVNRAGELGYLVLSARPTPAEKSLAFAALTDLLAPVGDEVLAALPDPQRWALERALLRRAKGSSGYDQRAVCAATHSVLRELTQRHRVIMAIDDSQWVDRASARVLEYVVRRFSNPSFRIVVCERPERGPLEIRRALDTSSCVELPVNPLDESALGRVIASRLGRKLPLRALRRICKLSGGNPFFALELARAELLAPGGYSGGLPSRLQDVVEQHLSTLPASTRRLLLAASATRAPNVELISRATGIPSETALNQLEAARHAGVIEIDAVSSRVYFVHPLFEAGVYSDASPAARRRVHTRLSQLVGETEERARHLALCAEGPDGLLASALDVAAEHARSRGAPEAAGEFAEQALQFTPGDSPDGRFRRSLNAATYRFHAGDVGAALALLDQARAQGASDNELAKALRLQGEIRLYQSSAREAQQTLTEALALARGDAENGCRIELLLSFAANVVGDFLAAQRHANCALELVDAVDDRALVSETLAVATMTDFLTGKGVDEQRLKRALELEDPYHQVAIALRPSLIAGLIALYVGRLDDAVRFLTDVRASVVAGGDESDLAFVASNLSWAETLRGNLDGALESAREAIDTAQRLDSVSAECFALAVAAVADAFSGNLERASQRAQRALGLTFPMGGANFAIWAQWALVVVALSLGDPSGAVDAAEQFLAFVELEGLPEPVRVMALSDGIEALIGHRDLERAEALLQVLSDSGYRLNRNWVVVQAERCRALLHAARGELSEAWDCIETALARCTYLELELEVARTELVAGQLARRRKQRRVARELLTGARTRFESCGAELWVQQANQELARVTTSKPDDGQLTATERRIADLAVTGLTNGQISGRMAISVKTVEGNMTRIYAKLGIRSRAELNARISRL